MTMAGQRTSFNRSPDGGDRKLPITLMASALSDKVLNETTERLRFLLNIVVVVCIFRTIHHLTSKALAQKNISDL